MVHLFVAILLLAIIGTFVYEKNFLSFENYLATHIIIPSELVFEDNDPITFLIVSDNQQPVVMNVKKILMCDRAGDEGYGIVSSQESVDTFAVADSNVSALGRVMASADDASLYTAAAHDLRTLVASDNDTDLVTFQGQMPSETSQCFVRFKFTTYTPNFNIAKEFETLSYPFDYTPQFHPARHGYYQFGD